MSATGSALPAVASAHLSLVFPVGSAAVAGCGLLLVAPEIHSPTTGPGLIDALREYRAYGTDNFASVGPSEQPCQDLLQVWAVVPHSRRTRRHLLGVCLLLEAHGITQVHLQGRQVYAGFGGAVAQVTLPRLDRLNSRARLCPECAVVSRAVYAPHAGTDYWMCRCFWKRMTIRKFVDGGDRCTQGLDNVWHK